VGAVALLAGADGPTAIRLAVAMTSLQVSIGTLNDLVDAPRDAGHKLGKPIPAGLVSRRGALVVAVVAGLLGVGLSVPSGFGLVILALVILAIGYGYDLWFKGTAWSWVPFAVGIPLLPVYGWFGTTGSLPGAFAVLLPTAVVAGAALAIANALADAERDLEAGVDSVAIRLGPILAWRVNAVLLAAVVAAALVTLGGAGPPVGPVLAAIGASAVIGLGVVIGRHGDTVRRERAWELEAVGVGALAAAWLAGVGLGS
jgi:4-hydroxybenzoate polyprenyltransferase